MPTVVIGCGRSGTNMVLEILRGSHVYEASEPPENKTLCNDNIVYPNNYLTKCDTCYFNFEEFCYMMDNNPEMIIIWTIRDARDMIMSKMRRGAPKDLGGDCSDWADDSTSDGAIKDMEKMMALFKAAKDKYPNRVCFFKMEAFILDTYYAIKRLCKYIGIEYHTSMPHFANRMRLKTKRERYKGIDQSQVKLWTRWKVEYDGWLVKRNYDMDTVFKQVQHINEFFGYK